MAKPFDSFDHQTFLVEVELSARTDPKYRCAHYVRVRDNWCGSWFTHDIRDARRYKTRNGAQRWLADRPHVNGRVVSVVL